MNHTIEINREHGYIRVTTVGRATAEGFQEMTRELWGHPEWREGMNLLLDHRPLDSRGLTAKEIRLISRIRPERPAAAPFRRIASVVETDLGFGLTRMWDFYTDGDANRDHRIFRSLEEATHWLEEAPPAAAEREA